MVLLSGEDRHLKGRLPWLKTYEFSILWGLATDSLDQLGLVTGLANESIEPSATSLASALATFEPGYLQTQPSFSARRVDGESSHFWAQRQIKLTPHTREVDIIDLKVTGRSCLTNDQLLAEHQAHLKLLQQEFRQAQIMQNWRDSLATHHARTRWQLTHFQVTTSPGSYIRQLTQDIAHACGLPATTWRICRTQNGPFSSLDSEQLSNFSRL